MTLTYIRIVFQSICLLVALYQSNSQAADTNLVDDAYTQELARMDMIAGSCTNLVAAADWSKLVYDSRGNGLRGRLPVVKEPLVARLVPEIEFLDQPGADLLHNRREDRTGAGGRRSDGSARQRRR